MKKLFTLMVMVMMAVFAISCEKDDEFINHLTSEETSRVKKEEPQQPKQDTLTFNRDLKVNGNEAVATLTALVNGEAKATATTRIREYRQKNGYAITAEQRSITPTYANANTSEENGKKTFSQEDGNNIYVEVSYTDTKLEVNGEEKEILADRLEFAKVFNLDEIQPEAATKAVVTDTLYNQTVVEFRLENYQDASYLEDETLVRYYSYEVADPVVSTTDKWELVANRIENGERYTSVDHIQYYSDGSHSLIKNYSARIPVSAKVLSNWERTAKDFSQNTASVSAISTDKVAGNNGEGVYWSSYTVVYGNDVTLNGASASNSWEIKEAREVVVKENGEVVYTFPELNSSVSADNGNISDKGDYADYSCTLSYTYDNTKMSLVAPGKIVKEQEEPEQPEEPKEPVKTEDWDEKSAKDELTDTQRITSIDYVWYEDGKEVDRQNFQLTSSRSIEVLTDWSSEQKSFAQSTSAATFTTSSDAESKAEWSYNKTTVFIKNAATLEDGSQMKNEWRAYEVTNIKVTNNGKSYTFSNKEIYVSDNATVDANGVYGDKLTYIYGDNYKYVTAPGKITIKEEPQQPEEPEQPVTITGMEQTVCPNATRDGYFYTIIIRYSDDTMLPIVIDKDGGNATTFTKVANDDRINGMSISSTGDWVLTKAKDAAESMDYTTVDGKINAQMSYTKAKRIGWDNGNTVNGHASVTTSRFELNGTNINDTYNGNNTVISL